jgi:hypothetical protein
MNIQSRRARSDLLAGEPPQGQIAAAPQSLAPIPAGVNLDAGVSTQARAQDVNRDALAGGNVVADRRRPAWRAQHGRCTMYEFSIGIGAAKKERQAGETL